MENDEGVRSLAQVWEGVEGSCAVAVWPQGSKEGTISYLVMFAMTANRKPAGDSS
jgi:hypothetical protein